MILVCKPSTKHQCRCSIGKREAAQLEAGSDDSNTGLRITFGVSSLLGLKLLSDEVDKRDEGNGGGLLVVVILDRRKLLLVLQFQLIIERNLTLSHFGICKTFVSNLQSSIPDFPNSHYHSHCHYSNLAYRVYRSFFIGGQFCNADGFNQLSGA
ncbi:hypothetical protein BT96DRAFT_979920 [Gymnopus androsaceus JB14]|uniref:Uncharacterized protein n=1 Tax=Gymnopus androsaceus JB14 TaxID=1447944 RepID=A0A6A4GZ95_9AGAR|nr:hypothetical protein BT96DRAFT_979920 [Gymnopus androsaceus JB14]